MGIPIKAPHGHKKDSMFARPTTRDQSACQGWASIEAQQAPGIEAGQVRSWRGVTPGDPRTATNIPTLFWPSHSPSSQTCYRRQGEYNERPWDTRRCKGSRTHDPSMSAVAMISSQSHVEGGKWPTRAGRLCVTGRAAYLTSLVLIVAAVGIGPTPARHQLDAQLFDFKVIQDGFTEIPRESLVIPGPKRQIPFFVHVPAVTAARPDGTRQSRR
ncbi:MAG: hypothetical protein JWR80_4865 [Bradyrhizobium sp.]|nr:hypothetical protein [Bradyrhizobium sp.]